MTKNGKTCGHCGAAVATMFANDGSAVCERCFAYDQVVAGELRVSQADLGMIVSGDAANLDKESRVFGRWELIITLVLLGTGVMFFWHAITAQSAVAYFGGGLVTVMALMIGVQAYRTFSFAKRQAPELMKRAVSAPPPPMPTSKSVS